MNHNRLFKSMQMIYTFKMLMQGFRHAQIQTTKLLCKHIMNFNSAFRKHINSMFYPVDLQENIYSRRSAFVDSIFIYYKFTSLLFFTR
jgi:hypothetical protein